MRNSHALNPVNAAAENHEPTDQPPGHGRINLLDPPAYEDYESDKRPEDPTLIPRLVEAWVRKTDPYTWTSEEVSALKSYRKAGSSYPAIHQKRFADRTLVSVVHKGWQALSEDCLDRYNTIWTPAENRFFWGLCNDAKMRLKYIERYYLYDKSPSALKERFPILNTFKGRPELTEERKQMLFELKDAGLTFTDIARNFFVDFAESSIPRYCRIFRDKYPQRTREQIFGMANIDEELFLRRTNSDEQWARFLAWYGPVDEDAVDEQAPEDTQK